MKNMTISRLALEYPVTIRVTNGHILISCPDLGISFGEELKSLDSKWILQRIQNMYGKTWADGARRLSSMKRKGQKLPEPSLMRVNTKKLDPKELVTGKKTARKKIKSKPLTVPDVAKMLGVSAQTVRRIPKRNLHYWLSKEGKGGHRRYSVGAVRAYLESIRGWSERLASVSPRAESIGRQQTQAANEKGRR